MTQADFFPIIKSLANCFGKSDISAEQAMEYFYRFRELSAEDFTTICEAAKDAGDRFPSRKMLVQIAVDKNFFEKARMEQTGSCGLVPVECVCGSSFVVTQEQLIGFESFGCPGHDHGKCNLNFSAEYLRNCTISHGVIRIKEQERGPVNSLPSFEGRQC